MKQLAANAHFHEFTPTSAHLGTTSDKKAAAFGSCSVTSSVGCPDGYVCKGATCMPTAATTATFKHDSGFATRLAHAEALQVEAQAA